MTLSYHDPSIVQALDRLEADLRAILARHTVDGAIDQTRFWPDFAGVADDIVERADGDAGYARERIDAMLSAAGLGAADSGSPASIR